MEREIIALAASIVIVIVLVRLRVDLGLSMLAAAASLALVVGRTPLWTLAELGRSAIRPDTLILLGRIITIIALGALAGRLGYLDRLVSGLKRIIPDNRIVIALMPAFGGLLPMPGGTMLTAPMVESAVSGRDVTPEQKLFVSYWFRHVWEYIWPLYPGVVVGAAVIGRGVPEIFLHNYPLTIAAILGGYFFVLRRLNAGRNEKAAENIGHARRDVLMGVLPFGVVIVGVLVLKLDVVIVVPAVLLLLAVIERAGPRDVLLSLKRGTEFQIVTLIVGVAAYQHLLQSAGIIDAVPGFFLRMHMPQLLVIGAVPLLIGLITGVTLAFIAVSFPLLLPLMGGADVDMSLVMFAFASGFVGCLLSPVHLCLVLTREYFRADLGKTYRMLLPPALVILATAGLMLLL